MCVMCHVSCVTCIMCHVSRVTLCGDLVPQHADDGDVVGEGAAQRAQDLTGGAAALAAASLLTQHHSCR